MKAGLSDGDINIHHVCWMSVHFTENTDKILIVYEHNTQCFLPTPKWKRSLYSYT